MAAVAPPADQAADLLKNISLDSQSKTLEVSEPAKKPSVDSGDNTNGQSQPLDRSLTPMIPDIMDPTVAYFPNGYASSYYYGGYDGANNGWDDYSRYVNLDGVDASHCVYGDNGSIVYPGYGYAPFGPYSPAGSPVPTQAHDGQLYGGQHYQYLSPYFQPMNQVTVPSKGDISKSAATCQPPLTTDTSTNGVPNSNAKGNTAVAARPAYQNGFQDPRVHSTFPWLDSPVFSNGQAKNKQTTLAKEGKRKASSNLHSNFEPVVYSDGDDVEALPPEIKFSKFDYSVENYFKLMDKITMLSGESEFEYEQTEIQRLTSSVTFLSKWRDFIYQPRAIRFACEKETSKEKDVTTCINLPQFSSAAVPKDKSLGNKVTSQLSKDFVMNVGGPVWALDWCPRVHKKSTLDTNVEFIAVSAHPPESSYHKIGNPLTGRGLIQIWCLLNTSQGRQVEIPLVKVKSRKAFTNIDPTKPKRPRGRPRKPPINKMDSNDQLKQDLPVQSPESSNNLLQLVSIEEIDKTANSCKPQKPRKRPRKKSVKKSSNNFDGSNKNMQPVTEYTNNSPPSSPEPITVKFPDKSTETLSIDKFSLLTHEILAKEQVTKKYTKVFNPRPLNYSTDYCAKSTWTKSKSKLTKCQTKRVSQVKGDNSPNLSQKCENPDQDDALPGCQTRRKNQEKDADSPNLSQNCESPLDQDNVLPRLVMGLAHNGIVAWDVKWRPFDTHPISKHIMGYLAVLLGNGALEVWEVPLPHVTKAIFSSCQKKDNDPRFLKLKPVFLCSMLKSGDRQSIPLTLEWSASAPHDLILAGCHDGVVALWKFSASSSSKDTRPLLCFNADTVPIRTLKWAPLASDPESANTIVTAGHNGLKFWDLRDPFHPLWDIPSQKNINSLDWLPNPRCVLLSLDDGEIKIISLLTAACDVPVTGMPSDKKPQHGTYSYYCSSSSIWSVQASRSTGMVAYCCSDGKVVHFQLTTKAVEKDPHRNREPHYLCGSITEEDSCLTVLSPLPNIPIPMKISSTEWGDTPKTSRGVKSRSNQEKRAKEQISKCQTPPKQTSEGTQLETQTQTSRALVCIDNDTKIEDVENVKIEVFPPKSVAMHRATWNMNKGGERLVCYGGAAGILRCQEIM